MITRCLPTAFRALLPASLLALAATGCMDAGLARVSVWIAPGDADVLPDSGPAPENPVYSAARQEVALDAAINETVGFQVALRTTTPPVGPLDVRVSDLTGPGGVVLRADDVVMRYRVQYTRVAEYRSWYPEYTGRPAVPALFPDILVPWTAPRGGGPLQLNEARTEPVWIDVRVPPTAAPGTYQGRLEVHAARGTVIFATAVRLRVVPVALPGRRSLQVVCGVDPRDLLERHFRWPRVPAEELQLLANVPSHFAAVGLVRAAMRELHAHRLAPVLWASFPKYHVTGLRDVEVDWTPYDALVADWLDGSAFADRARLEVWVLPVSRNYPDAERNGGFDSPGYARILSAYLQECVAHFRERGWLDRAILRVCPPRPLTQPAVDELRILSQIVRQSETSPPIVAHLPAHSLAGLGWHRAPAIDVPDVAVWSPPAMWYEPEAMQRARNAGERTWFMPDRPPYSASLAVEAPALDARLVAWQAYRYGAGAVWIEHAADLGDPARLITGDRPWVGPGLLYPGDEYGLPDEPVPSLRLKRLRRGVQDYELLRLLEDNGRQLLARNLAEQVVRWAFTDACDENLLSTRTAGWPRDPEALRLARSVILDELVSEFEPGPAAQQRQLAGVAKWSRLWSTAAQITAVIDGLRLTRAPAGLRAHVRGTVQNATARELVGTWTLPDPPAGWELPARVEGAVPPAARRPVRFDLSVAMLSYDPDGIYPFALRFDSPALGAVDVPARLAVAACVPIAQPPRIDGRLDDWPLAANNIAADFRLTRAAPGAAPAPSPPTLPTQAFFVTDRSRIYVGVRCELRSGEPPVWKPDNVVPIDGGLPWEQDVVEILIDPRATPAGTQSDLYALQIKPSGLLLGWKGCRTEPPMGPVETWNSGTRVAVTIGREAWVVELAIPLDAFEPEALQNAVWGVNVTRLDARRGEYSTWSGARGYAYDPESLGNLLMPWP